jgi:hypothetical protein
VQGAQAALFLSVSAAQLVANASVPKRTGRYLCIFDTSMAHGWIPGSVDLAAGAPLSGVSIDRLTFVIRDCH